MDNQSNKSDQLDSAILILGESDIMCKGQIAPPLNNPNLDGHQILNQVQLQFIPTGNENLYVAGQLQSSGQNASSTSVPSQIIEPSAVVVGSLNEPICDTDFLVDSQTVDLGSPVPGPSNSTNSGKSIWKFNYYSKYFDLTSDMFFRRILWSLLPLTGGEKGTYIDRYIHANPDLYGPFWIPMTLAFTITICNDIIKYLNLHNQPHLSSNVTLNQSISLDKSNGAINNDNDLYFGFDLINMATTITFSYVIFVPLILWSFCNWRHCQRLYSFIECFCAYGYSLSLFIPITILSLINIGQIQFILFFSAAFLSGSVLLISFAPVVHSDPSNSFKFAYVMLIFILVSHLLLSLFYLYIFL